MWGWANRQRKKAMKKSSWPLDEQINVGILVRVYRNLFAILAETLKCNHAFDQGKQGVILAATNIVAGVDLGATLAIDDVAGFNAFAAEFFAAEALSARVSAVS